jgi:cytochrome b561
MGAALFLFSYVRLVCRLATNGLDCVGNKEDKKMKEWLISQFMHFNVLMLIVIFFYTGVLTKMNMQKQLKEQSEEFYKWHEEIKDEIRGLYRK